MRTVGVTSDVAFATPPGILPPQRKHVTAVATPVGAEVCDGFESMRYTMVDLFRVVVLPSGSQYAVSHVHVWHLHLC